MAQKRASVGSKLEERKRASEGALAKRVIILLVVLLAVLFLVTAGSAKIPWWGTISAAVPVCVWMVYDIVKMLMKQKELLEEKLTAEADQSRQEGAGPADPGETDNAGNGKPVDGEPGKQD
ncbi:MAG: hypothetical protein JW909_13770 [Planctomycetes bacterium]|nr:hypothetical protein [Planctomycetota bacterium]